jgi:hypothetical protein
MLTKFQIQGSIVCLKKFLPLILSCEGPLGGSLTYEEIDFLDLGGDFCGLSCLLCLDYFYSLSL